MSCPYYSFKDNDYYCAKQKDYTGDTVYWRYCRGYDYESCPHYSESGSSGCYLTTACVRAKGLPDNCEELMALRRFRDGWLQAQPFGQTVIEEYYSLAPLVVEGIDHDENAEILWNEIYETVIAPCVKHIHDGKELAAFALYSAAMMRLKKQFVLCGGI